MCECTEHGPWTVPSLLHVITLGRLVDLRMELLLRARMTVLATVALFAIRGLSPLLAVLHVGTRRGPVLVLPGTASLVLAVVVLGTRVPLPAQTRWSLARFRLVVGQHKVRVLPLGILVHQIPLLVQGIRPVQTVSPVLGTLQRLQLLDVEHGRTLVLGAVSECTVVAVLHAVAPGVRVVDAHACLVVAQVVATLRVTRRPMQELATARTRELG